jgi:hypothetical protein
MDNKLTALKVAKVAAPLFANDNRHGRDASEIVDLPFRDRWPRAQNGIGRLSCS